MGCSTKKFRIERLPRSTIPLSFWSRMPFPSVVLLGTHTRAFGGPDRRLLGVGGVGLGSLGLRSAHTHDVRKPARLREGLKHQDQEDRERSSQKRPGSAEQPRPEDEPDKEDRRRDA